MEYDEIRITTRREIAVCRDAIRRLERSIAAFEAQYRRSSTEFLRLRENGAMTDAAFTPWSDCCQALDRWQRRLAEHEFIMNW